VGRRSGSSEWVVEVGGRSRSLSSLFKEGWNRSSERVALDQVVVVVERGLEGRSKQAKRAGRRVVWRRLRSEDWTGCRRSKWAGKVVVLVNGGWTGRR
jgi:hypothetical protein